MKMAFYDRVDEKARLEAVLKSNGPALAVVYGRRRCGKSTLLQKVIGSGDVYFLADQREASLQIRAFAEAVGAVLPGFTLAQYQNWDALLQTLVSRCDQKLNVVIDEFPYLVQSDPALPSLLQRLMDQPKAAGLTWVLCGSSQRMMQGVVLDHSAPLYGRAREILKIRPLEAGWLPSALGMTPSQAMEACAIWGGVPRYWELARNYTSTWEAVSGLLLDRNGVLHDEPSRLLVDDVRSPVQTMSLLSVIGSGCHRMSEIAARVQKPASSLTRPLGHLIELGYVHRELPWGESLRSTKRTLYRLSDPFLRFYYRFVLPNQSLLELGQTRQVLAQVQKVFPHHGAGVWEDLARRSIPFCRIADTAWSVAARWWGQDMQRQQVEVDVVAESVDGKSILIGEVKWGAGKADAQSAVHRLRTLADSLPFVQGRRVVLGVWTRERGKLDDDIVVLTPDDVLRALKR
jgi:AAA+ ATPase superfamily predicted ATPase